MGGKEKRTIPNRDSLFCHCELVTRTTTAGMDEMIFYFFFLCLFLLASSLSPILVPYAGASTRGKKTLNDLKLFADAECLTNSMPVIIALDTQRRERER